MSALRYQDYVASVGEGELVSRAQMAGRMGVTYSTAVYNLEKAVEKGMLLRLEGFVGRQPGWVYGLPESIKRLGGM